MPWPTPMHMVHRAVPVSRAASSTAAVRGQAGAAHAQRVPQGDRAAVGVHVVGVVGQAEVTQEGQGLRGEGLVQLDHVDVGDRAAQAAEELAGGRRGTHAHDPGRHARVAAPTIRASGTRP
jgi:hypothetical protein